MFHHYVYFWFILNYYIVKFFVVVCSTDKPKDHEHFGFIAFCSVLIVLLGVLMIGCATRLKRERVMIKI
jgi:hypothetical protein